jgi:hypothetical protein
MPGCSECYEEQLQPAAGIPHTKPSDDVTIVTCTACAAPLYKFNADSERCGECCCTLCLTHVMRVHCTGQACMQAVQQQTEQPGMNSAQRQPFFQPMRTACDQPAIWAALALTSDNLLTSLRPEKTCWASTQNKLRGRLASVTQSFKFLGFAESARHELSP